MAKRLFVCLLVLLLLQPIFTDDCQAQFQATKKKCNRNYDSDENQRRMDIFCEKYAEIQEFNEGDHGYKKGVNCLTDRTNDQIKSMSNLNNIPKAKRKSSSYSGSSKVGAPTQLDWRDSDVVTSVKDQGSCGSCWTFAAAAYCESKIIQEGTYDTSLDLSEQYFLECTSQSDCGGGYMEYVMDQATKSGVPEEDTYPYSPYSSYSGICFASGIHCGYEEKNYYGMTDDEMIDLLQTRPIAVALASDNWSGYSSGTFSCAYGAAVDHAVVIVGYTPDYWIVKNQWGSSWGMNGYIYITRDRNYNCQIGSGVYVMGESKLTFVFAALMLLFALML